MTFYPHPVCCFLLELVPLSVTFVSVSVEQIDPRVFTLVELLGEYK